MSFELEERYVVLKISLMSDEERALIKAFLNLTQLPTIECIVVEDDWPEYEMVWKSLEGRC